MQCKGLLTSTLAAFVAVGLGLGAAPAGAELNVNGVGALAVAPYITSDFPGDISDTETYITVTNAKSTGIVLEIRLIEGPSYTRPPGGGKKTEVPGNWDVESYSCPLTGNETVLFVADSDGNTTVVTSSSLSCTTLRAVDAEAGVIVFSVQGDDGNAIFADWVVSDFDGDWAFGAEAISFQAGPVVNTDDIFLFDGTEYAHFPSALGTNFLFPDNNCDISEPDEDCRAAALMLFTLDGAAGFPPAVQANIDFYDQYEQPFDADLPFSCFTVADFHDISPNLTREFNPGSEAGHMVLEASAVVRTPFHGWIIQHDFDDCVDLGPAGSPDCDGDQAGFWARTLAQSGDDFDPGDGEPVAFIDD